MNYTATVAADVDEVTVTATPAVDASVMLAPADADTALDLTLTGATLAPAFTANLHDYAATVANTVDEVTVAATAAHTGTEHVTLDLTTASTDATPSPSCLPTTTPTQGPSTTPLPTVSMAGASRQGCQAGVGGGIVTHLPTDVSAKAQKSVTGPHLPPSKIVEIPTILGLAHRPQ